MAGFLYFTTSRQLPETLSYAFDSKPHQREVLFGGPTGGGGMVWVDRTWDANLHRLGYFRDEQTWFEMTPGVWCGWYTNERPTPEDVKRTEQLEGQWVTFEDGSRWLVPVARMWNDDLRYVDQVPRLLTKKDGKYERGDVVHRYRELWRVTVEWFEHWAAKSEEGTVTIDDASQWCSAVMSANYRVSFDELVALGAVSEKTQGEILYAVIDLANYNVKKKALIQSLIDSIVPGDSA